MQDRKRGFLPRSPYEIQVYYQKRLLLQWDQKSREFRITWGSNNRVEQDFVFLDYGYKLHEVKNLLKDALTSKLKNVDDLQEEKIKAAIRQMYI